MIRTLAAVAALAAIPALATAQTPASDENGFTVLGQHPGSYSIIIQTAGKSPQQVRAEIWNASYTACERAPLTGNRWDYTTDAMQTCVNQAQWDAADQYNRILAHGASYAEGY